MHSWGVEGWNSKPHLHDLGVDLVELWAAAALATHFLVLGVLLTQRVEQLHDLRLSQELVIHWRPGHSSSAAAAASSSALGAIKPPLLQLRQQLMTLEGTVQSFFFLFIYFLNCRHYRTQNWYRWTIRKQRRKTQSRMSKQTSLTAVLQLNEKSCFRLVT